MAASSYQSLYRRYRSQRFSEVLGQDHVTRALRNAVRDGRVGHAYLFSGPRGTGKTSTARILAKALNCAAPQDGEPDCVCDNCVAVERGQLVDWLLEQDAASKSKVDDMRDLLDRVPLGTSGNRKVIILDEVHMLSQGAENALLKTLEEPPEHVVFVLATTDPQKVRPTIRSRTQQFEFHLLPPDLLAEHVRHVIHDAGLVLDDEDEAVAHVVRLGGGSARDTLSALDQVAALGEVVADTQPVDAVVEALAADDAGAALVAVADAMATGRDPRGLGEAVIGRLRDAFLAVMGVGDDHLPASERTRAGELGEKLGAAGLTRALDVLGEALTELSRKPDPRIVLEVALVRLTRPDADRSLDAVLARLERLERAVRSGDALPSGGAGASGGGGTPSSPRGPGPSGSSGSTSPGAGSPTASSPQGPRAGAERQAADGATDSTDSTDSTGDGGPAAGGGPASAARAALAAKRPAAGSKSKSGTRSATGRGAKPSASSSEPAGPPTEGGSSPTSRAPDPGASAEGAASRQVSAPPASAEGAASRQVSAPPASSSTATAVDSAPSTSLSPQKTSGPSDVGTLSTAWTSTILPNLPPSVRGRWRGGRWVEPVGDGVVRFALDNEWHQRACEDGRREVEQALAAHFGSPVRVELAIGGGSPAPVTNEPAQPDEPEPGDIGDVSSLADADDAPAGGVDLLLREFGGGQLVEEDPR